MKAVSLISGGIDSPVSTYLMLRSGVEVIALHMDNSPYSGSVEVEKALKIIDRLEEETAICIKSYVLSHGPSQDAFFDSCKRKLACVLCKRMMLRTAEMIAEDIGADAIITGDSIGQVASQTLQNLYVETQAVDIPIIRPLIGFDKNETIEIARKIGTYEISIIPGSGCSAVPKKPATGADLQDILLEEEKVDITALLEDMREELECDPSSPSGKPS
ncbi:MAG: 7-cyano-7-deazaguanine synthase [Halobacteriota archaeon]|nr:7-cyano-7-deazaguanine synthase [Halobacteriota archaeon]